jgi:small-conductance mechanosensitive channel
VANTPSRLFPLILWLLCLTGYTANARQSQSNTDSLQATRTLSELLIMADELNTEIRDRIIKIQDTTEYYGLVKASTNLSLSINSVKEETDIFLKPNSREWLIRTLLVKWNREEKNCENLLESITQIIQQQENALRTNRDQRTTWLNTRTEIIKDNLSESLHKPINDLLTNLKEEERLLQSNVRLHLQIQEKIGSNRKIIKTYLDQINPLLNQNFFNLFKRDDDFIWNRVARSDSSHLNIQINRSYQFISNNITEYIKVSINRFVLIGCIVVVIGLILSSVTKPLHEHSEDQNFGFRNKSRLEQGAYIFTLVILLCLIVLTNRPPLLSELLILLFTVTLIVFLIRKATGILKFITIGFLLLFWSDRFTNFIIIENRATQYLDLVHCILAALLLFLLYRKRQEFHNQFPEIYAYMRGSLIPFLFIFTCLAVIFEIIGFTSIARALTNGAIVYGYLAPVILINATLTRDLFKIIENSEAIKKSVLAQHYYKLIYTAITVVAYYLLITTIINAYSLNYVVTNLLNDVWAFGGTFGELTVTVGDVVKFFMILLISITVSGIVQVLVEGEILSRMNLRRGIGMAIGTILRYSIVVLGFLMAVASSGFDLNKISILAGAIGVGIGFGLQNLVANFISGLILIFERPFVVNDTIETDQIEGNVKEIGIRASKILTYDGAEVIIPNSNLISNRLSNYTLSNATRRQVILVKTSIQANPDDIIRILINIATHHQNILHTPEPFVLFDGQVEQSLQFKLYYWLMSDLLKTRSELNLQIHRELKSLGVELPVPVHEIITRNKTNP